MRKLLILSMFFAVVGCGQGYQADEIMPQESVDQELGDEGDLDLGEEPVTAQPGEDMSKASNPVSDPNFSILPDGRKLSSITVSGSKLSLAKGTGTAFSDAKMKEYLKLKAATLSDANHKVQWAFMDMDDHRIIEKSAGSHKRIFGASSSKVYVAAALLDQKRGKISSSQLQLMSDMLVVSSNSAWTDLQKQIGDGNSDKGRERIHTFTQRMGYATTRGFQGNWGKMHGNELVPIEAVEMLFDMYTGRFDGAELEWKLIHACRTGASRGRKYIPKTIYVAGKTGTYSGPTENPATGAQYTVDVKNHILSFNVDGRQYGLAIFANTGSDESAALIAGGLLREYTSAR